MSGMPMAERKQDEGGAEWALAQRRGQQVI